ncbi:TetR-like C-terminal domain-containing protein [Kitasatospora aburaviensis]
MRPAAPAPASPPSRRPPGRTPGSTTRTATSPGPTSTPACSTRSARRSPTSPAGVALALRLWGHLHGLVSLEIYGHLRGQLAHPDKLFEEELNQLVRTLGIPRPA